MSILPTYSQSGWVTNPLEKIDFLLAYFFETQKSQTHFHEDNQSFQSILADYNEPYDIKIKIEEFLRPYLSSHFNNVQLNVTIEPLSGVDTDVDLLLSIECDFEADGVTYSIGNAIEVLGTQVKKIYRLNETGQL